MLLLGEQLQKREPATALEWFSAAAEKGDATAMTRAALLLSNGVGPASSPEKVVQYLNGAAEMSEPNAMFALGQLHLSGDFGVKQDNARGIELLRAAADKGNSRAKNALGNCYRKGTGVERNFKEAFRYFSEAEKSGSVEAIGNLGAMYFNGEGVPKKDYASAAKKFMEASEKGDLESTYRYAICVEGGLGMKADKPEAVKWFKKAAEAGHAEAAEWCKKNGIPFTPPPTSKAE
jgi:uncharacterized protein